MNKTTAKRMLTTRDVAAELEISQWWVRHLIRAGELRAVNLGGADRGTRYRVDPVDLATYKRVRETRARELLA